MPRHSLSTALSPFRAETAHRPMMLIILLVVALGLAWERVPAENGLGWDGLVYARMIKDLSGLSTYHAQRILPALVVKELLAIVGAAPTPTAIVRAFCLYNAALIILCGLLWKVIADTYRLGIVGRWVGFCGLFLSFQSAKMNLYNPVLTDTTALAFGMLMVFLYGSGRRVVLMAVSIIGALAWPTISLCGALLLLFPRGRDGVEADPGAALPTRALAAIYLAVTLLAVAGYKA